MRRLDYIAHHGVKGQRWGVRRYQYKDGSLTSLGKRHYGSDTSAKDGAVKSFVKTQASNATKKYYENQIKKVDKNTANIGNRYADLYLDKDTDFYRIQSNDEFDGSHAFYATYKKDDVDKYAGLFGKNLSDRAKHEGADTPDIHQLRIKNVDKLKVPSEQNAAHIVGNLMSEPEFNADLRESITDSKSKMLRPQQQMMFNTALKSMDRYDRGEKLTERDEANIYKAFNLTLVNHNDKEIRAQNRFYDELKQNGYSAILDVNDASFSSYHAKSPVIIFDTDKVQLQSVTRMDSDRVDKLYTRYNTERIIKEIPNQVVGNAASFAGVKMSEVNSYLETRYDEYLND